MSGKKGFGGTFSFSNCHIIELDNGSLVLIVFVHYHNKGRQWLKQSCMFLGHATLLTFFIKGLPGPIQAKANHWELFYSS
jgi:hypothetical protein